MSKPVVRPDPTMAEGAGRCSVSSQPGELYLALWTRELALVADLQPDLARQLAHALVEAADNAEGTPPAAVLEAVERWEP